MKKENIIKIEEEITIGDVILEKGDSIKILKEMSTPESYLESMELVSDSIAYEVKNLRRDSSNDFGIYKRNVNSIEKNAHMLLKYLNEFKKVYRY